jgi:hypothetical protein
LTLDRDLMDAADLLPNEKVQVVDVDYADVRVMPTLKRTCWSTGVNGTKMSA